MAQRDSIAISLQKYIVHLRKDALENYWHIDDLLTTIVVYLYPSYAVCNKEKKLMQLAGALRPFILINQDRLSGFTVEALSKAICEEWCPTLSNKFGLLKDISPLFEYMDDNMFVHLKQKTFNGLLQTEFNDETRSYGHNQYTPPIELDHSISQTDKKDIEEVVDSNSNSTPKNKKNQKSDPERVKEAIREFLELYKSLRQVRKNNPNCYCHNTFNLSELLDIETPQYTWQWNFSQAEYEEIKKTLAKYADVIPQVIVENKICCKLVQLYVSEWYKREYNGNGNDDNQNAFVSIGTEYKAQEVCNELGVTEDNVYRANNDSNGLREWLLTIYVDGGLPLNYLMSPQKGSDFTRSIGRIIRSVDNNDTDPCADLLELCNNSVVNQSYQAVHEDDASIHDFIQETIIDGNLEVADFNDFVDCLRDLRAENSRNKIEIRLQVYKTPPRNQAPEGEFYLNPQIWFKEQTSLNECSYAISEKRLNQWGVYPDNGLFWLQIKTEDGKHIWKEKYSKCHRGDYIASSWYSWPKRTFVTNFEIKQIFSQWNLFVDNTEVSRAITNPLHEQGFIQLFSQDGFSWSSFAKNSDSYSAILFDRRRDCSLSEDENNFILGSDVWGWNTFEDKIEFTISGKSYKRYFGNGELRVAFNTLHPLTDYFDGRDDNSERLSLIVSGAIPIFTVSVIPNNCDGRERIINQADYTINYRKGSQGDFSDVDQHSFDDTGFYQLKITYPRQHKNRVINCFALPQEAVVRNIIENKRTLFIGFDGLCVSHNNQDLIIDNNGRFTKSWSEEIDYYHPESFYTISQGDKSFTIRYYQPIDASVVKNNSTGTIHGVGVSRNPIRIPILFLSKFTFVKLPDSQDITVNNIDLAKQSLNALMTHHYNDSTNIEYIRFQTFTHSIINERGTRYYLNIGQGDDQKLSFVFVPTQEPRNYQPINLQYDDEGYFFDIANIQSQGIIVQKIEKYDIPKNLIKPFFVSVKNDNIQNSRRERRFYRIGNYARTEDYNDAVDYFIVAANTGMYYACFDALLGLLCKYDRHNTKLEFDVNAPSRLSSFYKQYCDSVENVNYDALWRMADEFLFDWTLIPQSVWTNVFSGDIPKVDALFSHRRNLTKDRYWNMPSVNNLSRNQNIYFRTITGRYGRNSNSKDNANYWKLGIDARSSLLKDIQCKDFFQNIN